MEIIKEKIPGDKRELSSITLVKNGKRMNFTITKLGFLDVSFTTDAKKKLWIQEKFDIEQDDGDIYQLTDSLFFSYGNSVVFDSEDSSFLSLSKEKEKYTFEFNIGRNEKDDSVTCRFIDDTTENESLRNFFYGLQDVKLEKKSKAVEAGKSLKKNKKHIERRKDL